MANYYKIKISDIANGPGERVSIFFTGCDIKCKGCFNEELQDPKCGTPYTEDIYQRIKKYMKPYKYGLSILGGEPFSIYNRATVSELCARFKKDFPDKTIYIWSGYTIEKLKSFNSECVNDILKTADYLIDGPFIEELKDYNLKLRGSSNQRIINLKEY